MSSKYKNPNILILFLLRIPISDFSIFHIQDQHKSRLKVKNYVDQECLR